MTWFAFKNGHPDINAGGIEEKNLVSYRFHGYATKTEADAHPNSVNPLQEILLREYDVLHAGSGITQVPSEVSGGVNAIGDLAHRLTESSTWIRVGEFFAGGLLIYIGLKALTSGTPVGQAGQTVKRGVKTTGKIAGKLAA